jgi:multiple antibiotic resistance protein
VSFVSAALILFFVMDPLGNLPVFSAVLSHVRPERRNAILARELLIALAFLILFLFVGGFVLDLMSINREAIRVGGGIVLFLIAIRMIFPPESGVFGETPDGEPLVFPLAVPLIAGPSALATVLLLVESMPDQQWALLGAVASAWTASAVVLLFSAALLRVVGRRGLLAVERLMGMLLVMLSVQMVLEGVRAFPQ